MMNSDDQHLVDEMKLEAAADRIEELTRLLRAADDRAGSVERRIAELEEAIGRVRTAVEDEGPVPSYHRETMAQHRAEWTTLWAALDALLEEFS